jgi:phage-related protein
MAGRDAGMPIPRRRVLFYIDAKRRLVLLHGFIKKTQKTPLSDLELARSNKSKHERGLSQ